MMMLKNQPNNVRMECALASKGMEEYFVAKEVVLDDYKDEFEEGKYFGDDFQNP
jgi:hypothetical protein